MAPGHLRRLAGQLLRRWTSLWSAVPGRRGLDADTGEPDHAESGALFRSLVRGRRGAHHSDRGRDRVVSPDTKRVAGFSGGYGGGHPASLRRRLDSTYSDPVLWILWIYWLVAFAIVAAGFVLYRTRPRQS